MTLCAADGGGLRPSLILVANSGAAGRNIDSRLNLDSQ
jgi:hypothetical protein